MQFELLFIQKSFDVIDTENNNIIIGSVLMFENIIEQDEPDFIIVMIVNNKITHITSNIINELEVEKYLLEKYTIDELAKL